MLEVCCHVKAYAHVYIYTRVRMYFANTSKRTESISSARYTVGFCCQPDTGDAWAQRRCLPWPGRPREPICQAATARHGFAAVALRSVAWDAMSAAFPNPPHSAQRPARTANLHVTKGSSDGSVAGRSLVGLLLR